MIERRRMWALRNVRAFLRDEHRSRSWRSMELRTGVAGGHLSRIQRGERHPTLATALRARSSFGSVLFAYGPECSRFLRDMDLGWTP